MTYVLRYRHQTRLTETAPFASAKHISVRSERALLRLIDGAGFKPTESSHAEAHHRNMLRGHDGRGIRRNRQSANHQSLGTGHDEERHYDEYAKPGAQKEDSEENQQVQENAFQHAQVE
jgi:hypothetical protein